MCLLETVKPEEAAGTVQRLYYEAEKIFGKVPNVLQMYSANPHFLAKQLDYLGYYSQHPSISNIFFAYVRLLVSEMYNGEYCIRLNTAVLKFFGVSDEDILAARSDFNKVTLDQKEKSLLLYVLKAVKDPQSVGIEELNNIRKEGWSDKEIFDAVYHGTNHSGSVKLIGTFKIVPDF